MWKTPDTEAGSGGTTGRWNRAGPDALGGFGGRTRLTAVQVGPYGRSARPVAVASCVSESPPLHWPGHRKWRWREGLDDRRRHLRLSTSSTDEGAQRKQTATLVPIRSCLVLEHPRDTDEIGESARRAQRNPRSPATRAPRFPCHTGARSPAPHASGGRRDPRGGVISPRGARSRGTGPRGHRRAGVVRCPWPPGAPR